MKSKTLNKTEVLRQIIAQLGENLAVIEKAARASHAEATHESSKAENKYDTRGLEAAYLAGGQTRQAKDILDSIKAFEKLPNRQFSSTDPIDLGALVELQADRARSVLFIGPRSGGLEILFDGREITVLTPHSPLGQQLMGKKVGEHWPATLGGVSVKYQILSVA